MRIGSSGDGRTAVGWNGTPGTIRGGHTRKNYELGTGRIRRDGLLSLRYFYT